MNQAHHLRHRSAGKLVAPPLRRTALALLIAACFNAAQANPTLPQVVHGQATFNQQGNLFTITNTPNTIINWQSFSVNQGEITRFIQQHAGSSVLNRITGQDPSKILGSLQSNGKVFLINPNGVLFGRDARVDVAGLVASSLALSNQDFLAGKMNFNAGEQAGAVVNQGAIHAGSGGQILLIAPNVENSGIITAPNGDVLLAAGHSVQLADAANPDLRVVLSAPADQAINVGQIIAQGGRIGMAGALLNQRGVLNANSAVIGENGKIVLKATGKALLETGSVTSASNTAGKGGEITVLGEQVGMQGNAQVDASGALGGGTVLLGGDYQGKNAAIPTARQVALDSGASIKADALDSGDGGKVIVWGNETARVHGSISARGGAVSGNGGLVETSGHYLDVNGIRVDTAPQNGKHGKRGNWLLDPYDIKIVAGYGGELIGVDQFADAPASGTTTIGADTIAGASSNVSLQALRRIDFDSAISMHHDGIGITAMAGESINVNAPITTRGGAVTLSANDATGGMAYGSGSNLNLGAAITTNGGQAYLSGAGVMGAGVIDVGSGNLTLRANNAEGGIYLGGSGVQLIGTGSASQKVLFQADNISLNGKLNFGGVSADAEVSFKPLTSDRQIFLGNKPGGGLGLSNAELNNIAARTVSIGSATAGDLVVSQPLDLAIIDNGGVLNLNLETGGNLLVSNMVAMRQQGSTLRATAGALTVGAGGGLYADGTVSLVADNMTLGGAAQSISTASNGMVNLARRSSSGSIEVGRSAADSASSLGLSEAELKTIAAPTISIGSSAFAGTLDLQGGLDLTGLSTLGTLALSSSGGINLNGALAVDKNLTLTGGTINAAGAVSVGGNFLLDRGNWVQNAASLPAFFAHGFSVGYANFLRASGGDGSVAAPYRIVDVYGLQGVGKQLSDKNYMLAGDIDASGTASWNDGAGFVPLFGGDELAYSGVFDGGNHSIRGLLVHGDSDSAYFGSGLFARVGAGTIRNLNLAGGSVQGGNNVGALVGYSEGTISNVTSSAAVSGNSNVGGLVGANNGSISHASASGNVTGLAQEGGMSGFVESGAGGSSIGGLVGSNDSGGSISVARASGAVSGPGEYIGGLVGNNDGAIAQAYATGGVGGAASVGGLVGRNGGTIADAYATGAIGMASDAGQSVSRQNVGGVIGWSVAGSSASRLYFSGNVSGNGFAPGTVGAVVGRADAYAGVGPAYFNYETSGTYFDQGGSSGRSTAQMQQQAQFGSFNFGENAVWRIYDGHTMPMLKAFLTPLQVTASGSGSQVYDGQLASFTGTLTYAGLLNGDVAANGKAGYGNAVNVGSYALGGLWSTQYDITYAGNTSLAITPRALTLAVSGSKVYDGALGLENATFTLGNKVAGDTLGVTGTAQFADKNAGTGKLINASNIALSGNGLGNYSLDSSASGSGDIGRASLGVSDIHALGKVYDGSRTATVEGTLSGVIGSDQVQFSGAAASFADKNVGSKVVSYSVAGDNLAGADAGNYVLHGEGGSTSASITARTLHLTFAGVDKIYDASLAAGVSISDDRVDGDVLSASATAVFGDKNAGSGKTVTVTDASIAGTDAGNYTLASASGATTANIAQRTLNLGFTGVGKVYDGSTSAVVSVTDDRVDGDVLTASASAAFGDKNAGSGKTVTVQNASLAGTDAGNYAIVNTGGTSTADIARRGLNLNFTGVNKVYDGLTGASVTVGDDRVSGDVLTASANAAFGDKNAGNGKTVTVQNASLAGTDAGNYAIVNTGGTATADIARRDLNLNFSGVNKVYDGLTGASVTVGDDRVDGDVLTASANAAFGDKNAGSGKTVTVQNASLSGTDAGNYAIVNTGGTSTADIARRDLTLNFSGVNKVYDGLTGASVTVGDDRISGDMLTASASAAFGDKNAGSGKTVMVQNASLSGTDAGNYAIVNTGGTATADIARRDLTLNFSGVNKVYDGLTGASVTVGDDRISGDVLTASANAAFGDKNAGNGKTVTVQNASLSGTDAGNYAIVNTGGTATADIARRDLTLNFSGVNKVYDGLTGASVTVGDDRVDGDVLTASANAAFGDKNAGSGKTVTVQNASLSGTDAGNYAIVNTGGTSTADIARRDLTLNFSGVNKVYDGLTGASVTVGDDRVSGDMLTASANAVFGDKNAGLGKTVTVQNASLAGTDAGNYAIVNMGGTATADIARRDLTLNFSGVNKVYDGLTGASVTVGDDRVSGDMLTASASAAFGDKNAGSGKTVTVQNASLSGTDAGNYAIVNTGGTAMADIARRGLNLNFSGVNKVYDGLTGASVTVGDDRVSGDVLTASANAAFGDKNAGLGKTVTVQNASLSGTDAGNYAIVNTGGTAMADIARRGLNLNFSGVNKVYDGLTGASVTVGDDRVSGDVLTASANAAFGDKNAGLGKTVTVQNASLAGTDAGNYAIVNTGGTATADIARRDLTLNFSGVNKVYDGLTGASVTVGDDRVSGDVLTASANAVFGDKNAGLGKTVTVQHASLAGTDAGNYAIVDTGGTSTADIARRDLNLNFTGVNKVYDGLTGASVTVGDDRVSGDVLTASASAAFGDKNAGSGKTVTVQNASLSGTDAGNYAIVNTGGTSTADIARRDLNLNFTGINKVYDGLTGASVTVGDDRVSGDVLTASANAVFGDKNAGLGKTVTVQNASLAGTDAGNYAIVNMGGTATADIARRDLNLNFTGVNKVYEGLTGAAVTIGDNRIAGDQLTASATAAFADKNAGSGKAVMVQNASLSGVDAGNYALVNTAGTATADIARRALNLSFAGVNKVYDGLSGAAVTIGDNRIAGDQLTASATAAFVDKNAGSGKTVTVQNASLSGADAGNYRLDASGGSTSASIAQRALSLAYTGLDKVYDGVTGAQVTISDNRIAGDQLSASASAAFLDKNAGAGKTVMVSNAALSGADAGNYQLASTGGAASASIVRAALVLAGVSAADKVYDGKLDASVGGTVAGVIGQDAVSLAGGSGTFADRNYGNGKTVTVSGFSLAGADAGNYTLNATGGVAQASIAQRALSTWIGAAGGLWSDAANWEGGVAPSGANVLAADFAASTGNVVYTAAAGDTVLDSLNSRGGLNLTGGSLLVNRDLSTASYAQSGGVLGGLGNVTVSNSFSQSGGAISIGGNLAITQASGDLRFASLTANRISLNAAAGAIGQSGAIVASSLVTQSQTGTVLNDAGNRVKSFSASNGGAGGIALTNTSAPDVLLLGSLATGAGDVRIESTGGIESHAIDANGGNVTLIAHSPVHVQGAINGNDVRIDASTEVAFGDGARVNAARAIAVTAGSGVTLDGAATMDVQSTGSINVLARNGDLTAAGTVRINSRGAPVSLLAPNGRVTVPASVLVAGPQITPVVPPATLASASHALPALNEQYNPLNQLNTPNNVTMPLLADARDAKSNKKESIDEPKNSGIHKTYCN